jgi:hypothetical protein
VCKSGVWLGRPCCGGSFTGARRGFGRLPPAQKCRVTCHVAPKPRSAPVAVSRAAHTGRVLVGGINVGGTVRDVVARHVARLPEASPPVPGGARYKAEQPGPEPHCIPRKLTGSLPRSLGRQAAQEHTIHFTRTHWLPESFKGEKDHDAAPHRVASPPPARRRRRFVAPGLRRRSRYGVRLCVASLLPSRRDMTSWTRVNLWAGFCAGKCGVRCGRAANARARGACMRTCGMCCEECNCVPTSARAGLNECPCYRDMLTAGPKKRPKCP